MNTQLLLTVGIIAFVLFILNAIFLTIIFFMRRKMAVVSQWPSTMGTVTASRIEQRSSSEVGGSGAGNVVERYPPGAQVMVFYNPQNPADAVLETKAPAQWLMWLILVIFDCVLCGVIPIIWWSMNQ